MSKKWKLFLLRFSIWTVPCITMAFTNGLHFWLSFFLLCVGASLTYTLINWYAEVYNEQSS